MWVIEDHEVDALADVCKRREKDRIIDHARAKMVFAAAVPESEIRAVLEDRYEKVDAFLSSYSEASYKSYVLATLIFAIIKPEVMATATPWDWLKNDRVGINTRVDLAYRMTKDRVREAS